MSVCVTCKQRQQEEEEKAKNVKELHVKEKMQNSAYGWTSSLTSSPSTSSSISKTGETAATAASAISPRQWSSHVECDTAHLNNLPTDYRKKESLTRDDKAVDLTAQLNASILEQISNSTQHVCIANSIGSTDSPVSNCSDSCSAVNTINDENNNNKSDDNNNQLNSDLDELWNIESINRLPSSSSTTSQQSVRDTFHRADYQLLCDEYCNRVTAGDTCKSTDTPSTPSTPSTPLTGSRLLETPEQSNQKKGCCTSETSDQVTSDRKKSKLNHQQEQHHNHSRSSVDINYSINHLTGTMHPSNTLSTLSSLQQPSLLQLTANSIVQMSNSNLIATSSLNSSGTNGSSNSTSSASGSLSHRRTGNGRNKSSSSSTSQQGKSFLCHVCHRTFTQKGNLKTHMMIHSGDKPYACNVSVSTPFIIL